MRHGIFGRKLSRNTNERKRLLVNLARELVKRGSIKTTLAKAKAVQPMVEKLITRAKKGKPAARLVFRVLADKESVNKLMNDAETRFAKRTSGFTRIMKVGPRAGDATEEALLAFVDEEAKVSIVAPETKKQTEPEKNKVIKPVKKSAGKKGIKK